MPTLTVDGREVTVPSGSTVLQACEAAGREVPVFCYHPRLNIAGNCRMCLVEIERSPKPQASCAMPAADGMVVRTTTPQVEKARKGVLELLLINHPLDCPICDQGGECDLQDLTLFYGPDHSRFAENKRPVDDKNLGPLIATHMTRCIHCTRCIRFISEIAGIEELGATGRGEHMEIGTWIERAVTSELSGNIIDLCPVGALNSKPYEYRARTWELRKTETIDVMDAVGCNIRVDAKGQEVMRVLPRLNEEINEEWISDKTRFAYDGLMRRRLDVPMVRVDGKLRPTDWRTAFEAVRARVQTSAPERIGAIVGDMADAEAMVVLKDLMARIGTPHIDCRQDGAQVEAGARAGYRFNTTIAGIERSDLILLVGTNPRYEASLVNARIRKRWRQGGATIARIGAAFDLTYPVQDLGAGPETLAEIVAGNHSFCKLLEKAEHPMIIVGQGALVRKDGGAILALARKLADSHGFVRDDWNGFNVLHTAASRAGGLELGLVPGEGGRDVAGMIDGCRTGAIDTLFLLGADEIDMTALGDAFVVYQGHHGDTGAHRADVILPGAAYTEKSATWVNTEGRAQRGKLATFPPGDAKEDWRILRALSEALGHALPLNSLGQVRARMAEISPVFDAIDEIVPAPWEPFGTEGEVDGAALVSGLINYYATNSIARASATMAACYEASVRPEDSVKTGTHG
ncbi:NADH-quinone oxidoreductase subunit NuoG [Marinivivus vitaminiproducens]|uniref:NADH-quinone oxidoreductase subunit NuoG n=1 Tax=Marinivivus vitaminiproducens TaxID=3035935 RepID=UPI0027A684C2|nr:NADH-quinone oxidoreductase subunit NuoG [Geminicoccaceae bacterium SCSIO 64248]